MRGNGDQVSGERLDGVEENAQHCDNKHGKYEPGINCINYASLRQCPEDINLISEMLKKVAVLRLNGGLGTSMGCKVPKSAIEVCNGQSFLDMAVNQVQFLNTKYGVDVPLILMNSFNTDEETKRVLSRYEGRHVQIITFLQACYPRIDKSTLMPIPTSAYNPNDSNLWFPPGHGDVYVSLARCGLLKRLLKQGKEYIFISNIDNLGTTVDLNILYHSMDNDLDFFMEVTKRIKQDKEGGMLVMQNGKPEVIEVHSLPWVQRDKLARDPRFDKFNTNNLWVSVRALQSLIASENSLNLPVIVRERQLSVNGEEVPSIFFETAAGSAISLFDKVCAVIVPRDRFFPVKTTDDLFAVQSSLFTLRHGTLRFDTTNSLLQGRSRKVPTVKLGPYFRTVEEYKRRLPFGVPDILELDHLTVSGDVRFRNNVVLKGTVIIVAEEGKRIDISSCSLLRDKVITGHLSILPH